MMRHLSRLSIAALATLALAVGPAVAAPRAVSFTPGGDTAPLQGQVQVSSKYRMAPGPTVHIPTFRIEVVRELQKSADTSTNAHQTSRWVLEGINDADMTAMADKLYAALVDDLTRQGFKVATYEETRANPVFAPLLATRAAPHRGPSASGVSSFYAPPGMGVNMGMADTPSSGSAVSAMAGFAAFGAYTKRALAAAKIARDGVIILEPAYTLGFATLDSSSERFLGRYADTASVSGRTALRLLPEVSRIEATVPADGMGAVAFASFKAPVIIEAAVFSAPYDATTREQRAGAGFGNMLGIAMAASGYGGGTSIGMNTKAVNAMPTYRLSVQPALASAQSTLLAAVIAPPQ